MAKTPSDSEWEGRGECLERESVTTGGFQAPELTRESSGVWVDKTTSALLCGTSTQRSDFSFFVTMFAGQGWALADGRRAPWASPEDVKVVDHSPLSLRGTRWKPQFLVGRSDVRSRGLAPLVAMLQASEARKRNHASIRRELCGHDPTVGGVLPEG